jgi:hypothetical protein
VYIYRFLQYRDAGWTKEIEKKNGTAVNATCQGNLSTYLRFTSHAIGHSWYLLYVYIRKYNIQRRILLSQQPCDWVHARLPYILG